MSDESSLTSSNGSVGKQLFLSKKAGGDEDVKLAIANQVEVDESLFEDLGDLDLDEELDIPDE